MKKIYFGLLAVAAACVLTACQGFGKKSVIVDASQLVGRWEAPSQASYAEAEDKLVFVFQNEDCIVDGDNLGKWGYQFDEGDDVSEADVLDDGPDGSYHKNGWFGWKAGEGEIRMAHMTSIGSAKTPTQNKVTAFSATSMTMQDGNKTYTFKKVK